TMTDEPDSTPRFYRDWDAQKAAKKASTGHWLFDQWDARDAAKKAPAADLPWILQQWDARDAARKAHPVGEAATLPPDGSNTAYGQAALDSEVHNVATAVEGTRNHTLNIAAFKLGTLVGAGQLHIGDVDA